MATLLESAWLIVRSQHSTRDGRVQAVVEDSINGHLRRGPLAPHDLSGDVGGVEGGGGRRILPPSSSPKIACPMFAHLPRGPPPAEVGLTPRGSHGPSSLAWGHSQGGRRKGATSACVHANANRTHVQRAKNA